MVMKRTIKVMYDNISTTVEIVGDKLVIPEGVENVHCYNNNLTELILPEGIKNVFCYNNNLTELVLPEGVEYVSCPNNNLRTIKAMGDINSLLFLKNKELIVEDKKLKVLFFF